MRVTIGMLLVCAELVGLALLSPRFAAAGSRRATDGQPFTLVVDYGTPLPTAPGGVAVVTYEDIWTVKADWSEVDWGDGTPPYAVGWYIPFPPDMARLLEGHEYTCPGSHPITTTLHFADGSTRIGTGTATFAAPTFTLWPAYEDSIAPEQVTVHTHDDMRHGWIDSTVVDWGDGTPPHAVGWSVAWPPDVAILSESHTYADPGAYRIRVTNHYADTYNSCQTWGEVTVGIRNGAAGVSDLDAAGYGLEPVWPNPARGGALTVGFVLPGQVAASLDLLDVAGRRMATVEVGSLGAGHHTARLGVGRQLPSGVYFVRLTQGGVSRSTPVVVVR